MQVEVWMGELFAFIPMPIWMYTLSFWISVWIKTPPSFLFYINISLTHFISTFVVKSNDYYIASITETTTTMKAFYNIYTDIFVRIVKCMLSVLLSHLFCFWPLPWVCLFATNKKTSLLLISDLFHFSESSMVDDISAKVRIKILKPLLIREVNLIVVCWLLAAKIASASLIYIWKSTEEQRLLSMYTHSKI